MPCVQNVVATRGRSTRFQWYFSKAGLTPIIIIIYVNITSAFMQIAIANERAGFHSSVSMKEQPINDIEVQLKHLDLVFFPAN